MKDFRLSLTNKLPLPAEIDEFNRSSSKKRGKELTLEYMEEDVRKLECCFNSLFVKLNMNTYKLNPLHYLNLPGYSFDCFLKLSKVKIDTMQDEQMLKGFISAIRGGICGVMGDRYVNNKKTKRFIDANN